MQNESLQLLSLGPGAIDYDPPRINYSRIEYRHEDFPVYLIGNNGTGKSSLSLVLSGAVPNSVWANVNLKFSLITSKRQYSLPEARQILRVIPQRWEHSYLGFSLIDELLLSSSTDPKWGIYVREKLDLTSLEGRHPSVLSTGEKKRVMIAGALMEKPVLIVSDEWSSHLDREWKQIIKELFEEYSHEFQGAHLGLLNVVEEDDTQWVLFPLQQIDVNSIQQNTTSIALRNLAPLLTEVTNVNMRNVKRNEIELDISIRYSHKHRSRVNLQASSGQFIEIIGPNGSGKTTLLENTWQFSRWPWRYFSKGQKIFPVHLIQADPTYQILGPTIYDEIQRVIPGDNSNRKMLSEKIRTELGLVAKQDVLTLSFGERKLLALITAVLSWYPIIALDEPLAGLDQENQQFALCLIKIAANRGKIVMISSQEIIANSADQRIDLS